MNNGLRHDSNRINGPSSAPVMPRDFDPYLPSSTGMGPVPVMPASPYQPTNPSSPSMGLIRHSVSHGPSYAFRQPEFNSIPPGWRYPPQVPHRPDDLKFGPVLESSTYSPVKGSPQRPYPNASPSHEGYPVAGISSPGAAQLPGSPVTTPPKYTATAGITLHNPMPLPVASSSVQLPGFSYHSQFAPGPANGPELQHPAPPEDSDYEEGNPSSLSTHPNDIL